MRVLMTGVLESSKSMPGKRLSGSSTVFMNSPDDRAGALGFGLNVDPPAPLRIFNRTMDLSRLQALADLIVADEEGAQKAAADQADLTQVQHLLLIGTAMGGRDPRRCSRIRRRSGSRSSIAVTTGETLLASSTPCWCWRGNAVCRSLRAD